MSKTSSQPCVGDPRFQRRIVLVMAFTVFLSVLNGTMFNVAVPDIRRQFGLTPTEVSWVVTGYIVVFALASVTYGKLADIYPVRRLVSIGLLLFNAGALLGFLSAAAYPLVVAARLLQAAGGGAVPALSMLVATRYFSSDCRGRVLGAMAATVAFAAGVGPIVGGGIAGALHWRYLFLLSLITLLSLVAFRRLLPKEASRPSSFDLTGAALLAFAAGALLAWISRAPWWLLPFAVIAAIWFWLHIHRVSHPFAPPQLLAGKLYRNALITVFLAVGPVFGMFLTVPLQLRALHDLPTLKIGLVIFPGALSAAVLGFLGGRMADRRGSVAMVHAGLGLLAAGFIIMAVVVGRDPRLLSLALVICYTGFSFIQSSLAKAVSTTLAPGQTGVGMGLYNLTFFTAGAFGTATAGRLLEILLHLSDNRTAQPWHYQSVFVISAATLVLASLFFQWTFRHQGGPDRDRSSP
jgi:DHA2 family metal-tetracycline-proton antiporter-like MFS transporter